MAPGPMSTPNPGSALHVDDAQRKKKKENLQSGLDGGQVGGGEVEGRRRSGRERKTRVTYNDALEEELRSEIAKKNERARKRLKRRGNSGASSSEKKSKKQKRKRRDALLDAEAAIGGSEEEDFEEGIVDLKQLDEETIKVHNDQLSPSLRESGVACLWEFACVMDFFQRFGREAYQKCVEVYRQHLKHERAHWHPEDIALYDDNRVFSCVFFKAEQLLKALETKYDSQASGEDANAHYWLLVDIHVMLLKGMHPRSRNPPCRMNWVDFLKTKITKSWDTVACGPVPSAFSSSSSLSNDGSKGRLRAARETSEPVKKEEQEEEEEEEEEESFTKTTLGKETVAGDRSRGAEGKESEDVEEEDVEEEEAFLFVLYNRMTPYEKLQCLRFLCELYCECPQINKRIDQAVMNSYLPRKIKEMAENKKPGEATIVTSWNKRTIEITGPFEYVEDTRLKEAFAKDFYGRAYTLIPLYPEQGHCLMVRERLGERWRKSGYAIKKGAASRSILKGGATHPPPLPTYEVVAASAEEFIRFVESHVDATLFGAKTRQKFREEEDKLKEQMEAEKEAELEAERVQKQMERVKKQLGYVPARTNSISQLEPVSRSRRSRQQVNYSFSEYDEMIDDALREQPARRSSRAAHQKPTAPPPPTRGERMSARRAARESLNHQNPPQDIVELTTDGEGNDLNPFQKFSMDAAAGGQEPLEGVPANDQRMQQHVILESEDESDKDEGNEDEDTGTQNSDKPQGESDYEPEDSDKEDYSDGGSDYQRSESGSSGSESEGLW